MSDHLIAEADRHAMVLPTTHPTHADIAWYVREVSELRAELALLREWQREVIQNANAHHAEREDAIARAERAEAEVKKLTGFYNEIVVECGHDRIVREYRQRGELLRDEANRRKEAEAELAAERARLDYIDSLSPGDAWGIYRSSAQQNANLHAGDPRTLRKIPGIRAAIDAAMKEETK